MTDPRGRVDEAYRAHGAALFRYLTLMSGDAELAGDVLHDTFATLLRKPPERGGELRGWLFRVATNRLRDVHRKRARRGRALRALGGAWAHSEPEPAPDRRVERAEAGARARRLLAALPERDRAILLMREQGFTHREIALAVGTTTGSVGTMIARALDRVVEAARSAEGGASAPEASRTGREAKQTARGTNTGAVSRAVRTASNALTPSTVETGT